MAHTEPKPETQDDVLGTASKQLNKVGLIVSSLIALSSTLFACSADNIKRNDAFMSAVHSQEKQWQELYDQYFAALAARKTGDDTKLFDSRLEAICNFSNREIPDFNEHQLGLFWLPNTGSAEIEETADSTEDIKCEKIEDKNRQQTASCQLRKLKIGLRSALNSNDIGSEASIECIKSQKAQKAAIETEKQDRADTVSGQLTPPKVTAKQMELTKVEIVKSEDIVQSATTDMPIRRALTLTVGANNGYDLDIFWCEGPDDREKWLRAKQLADTLSTEATNGTRIAGRYPIGRIRVRPLSSETQLSKDYPNSGFEVRGERNESLIGNALAVKLNDISSALSNSNNPAKNFVFRQSRNETKWYLSAFVCS